MQKIPLPECHALLDFVGVNLEPSKLIGLIRIKPWKIRRRGDEMVLHSSSNVTPAARTGYCSFSTRGIEKSSDINQHVALLLAEVYQQANAIKKVIREDKLKSEIVCFFYGPQEQQYLKLTDDNKKLATFLEILVVRESATLGIKIETDPTFISEP